MSRRLSRPALLLSLACWAIPALAAEPSVVRTQAQLQSVLASRQPTPLDALTPHGKRDLLRTMQWNEAGESRGFSYRSIVRELDEQQLAALLAFLDSSFMLDDLRPMLAGAPLRLPEPSPEIERRLVEFQRIADEEATRRHTAPKGGATVRSPTNALQHYRRLFEEPMDAASLRRQAPGDLLPLYDAARDFAATRPHLGTRGIPTVKDPLGGAFAGRGLYRYDRAAHTLTREAAPVPTGVQVVMVVNAGCQFSTNALAAVRGDAALQARLRQANLLILTPPASGVPFHYISEWNAANPTLPMGVPDKLEAWREVDGYSVPRFVVLRDGKVMGQVAGWPEEGNREAVLSLVDLARK
jgi:hypothetical protein